MPRNTSQRSVMRRDGKRTACKSLSSTVLIVQHLADLAVTLTTPMRAPSIHAHTHRQPDPPLISEHAMAKMIVLNNVKHTGKEKGDAADAAAGKRTGGAPTAARGVAVADALYPRSAIRMDWPAVRKVNPKPWTLNPVP